MTVEIIGYASVAPGAGSAGELFSRLRAGVCTVTEVPASRWDKARFWHPVQGVAGKTYTFAAGVVDDVNDFDPVAFGLSRREAMAMDPQQRLLLTVTWRALEDASLSLTSLREQVVGVYVGASSLDSANLSAEDPASGGPYFMTGNTLSIVANRLSHIFGLSGPSLTIDTACSSSLVALDQAVRALNRGEIDTAIVGGVNLLNHPLPFVGFAQARMLSPEGRCRAYDNNASGYVRAEGAVTVVLRRTEDARMSGDRSRARIIASGVNSAGRTNGISLPSPEAQVALLRKIYEEAAVDPNQVAFVEGHGTGTKVGDPAEVWAIGQVIGQRRHAPVPLGSIKTNIGHTEPASGLFGLMKAVMALENNYLPASLFFDEPNQDINFDQLNVRVCGTPLELLKSRRPRLAGVNSFGFGGTNAHVIVSDPEPMKATPVDTGVDRYFVASAHTKTALTSVLESYQAGIKLATDTKADEIVAASAAGRTLMRHRAVMPVRTGREVEAQLASYLAGGANDAVEVGEAPVAETKVAFVFAGNGAQWAGMGLDAYKLNKTFRRHFDAASALFEAHLDEKLVDLLADGELTNRLRDTRIAQPLLFSLQVALANCLLGAGVRPAFVLGHSIGEVAAAHVAGALSLVDAVAVVAARSKCQHVTRGRGTMAAALCSEDAARAFLEAGGFTDVVVAAVNARNSVTLSGPQESLERVRSVGRRKKIAVQPLEIEYPFHHPLIDDVKQEFLTTLPKIGLHAGEFGFVSTVSGSILPGHQLDAVYWWRNAREPVAFRKAVAVALEKGCNLLIEISPRAILGNYLRETVREFSANAQVISTFAKDEKSKFDPVARSVSRAFAHGAHGISGERRADVDLPGLPFEFETLNVAPTSDTYDLFGRNVSSYSLAGWRVDPNGTAWKNHIDAALFPDLAEHIVEGRAIMPGAGFVEIALQVAREHLKSDQVSLTNVELLSPMVLDSKLLEVSTVISPETGVIEIRSRERLSTDDWTTHAVARAQRSRGGDANAEFQPLTETAHRVDSSVIYRVASDFGLEYGPSFRLLDKAFTDGTARVDAFLLSPARAFHPQLSWIVNPMSLDSAFHGIVGLFDRISGDSGGAPYIPVHFGSIDLMLPGAQVSTVRIEIEKFSVHSVKARFRLEDPSGQLVLQVDDCRFRRTALRPQLSLNALGLHYETIPWAGSAASLVATPPDLLDIASSGAADSTLLVHAAIYRSCYDIIMSIAEPDFVVRNLPGDPRCKAFLLNCLRTLCDMKLAKPEGDNWSLEPESNLPTVEELLTELQADRADRGVEAVTISSIRAAMQRYLVQETVGVMPLPMVPSRSTLEHLRQHSSHALWRNEQVMDAVRRYVLKNPGVPFEILQIGAAASSVSRQIHDLVDSSGGRLTIVEPREDLRRPLEMAFEDSARVTIVDTVGTTHACNLVIAASDGAYRILNSDASVFNAVSSAVSLGGHVLLVESAASSISDFLFGLTQEWNAEGALAGMAPGLLATEREWQSLATRLGLDRASVAAVDGPYGPCVIVSGGGKVSKQVDELPAPSFVLIGDGEKIIPATASLSLSLDDEALAAELQAILPSGDTPGGITFLYAAAQPRPTDPIDLTPESWKIARFTTALRSLMERTGNKSTTRLVMLLPGGAPVDSGDSSRAICPRNSGLWALSRVIANETPDLSIHLIDAEPTIWRRALAVCINGGNDREWILSRDGSQVNVLRAVGGPLPDSQSGSTEFMAATVRQRSPSRVDALYWEACDIPELKPKDVLVEVTSAGLNFRDVMWAMGILPEEALEDGFAGATIGMELSGTVVGVGKAIDDLAVGDRVMGIGPAAFSTHAVISRAGLAKIPAELDPVAAATIPVTFLTAWYAIVELGRARAGETILIHGAAGGVGLAAVQICRHLGLKIIATVGSEEKRAYLSTLGVDHIFNSRSLSFVADVRRLTQGEGVDLVLNSLFSEAMEASIGLLKPFGRFLELGKRDYYADRKIGLRPFRRNVSYFGIDADQLPLRAPELTKSIFETLGHLFAGGELVALPYRSFRHDEVSDAFRLMQNAGHIGKIVIEPPRRGLHRVENKVRRFSGVSPDGTHVVIGGIGGFGLAAADWLVSKGARHLALVTRRGLPDEETSAAIVRWQTLGVTATLHACDVTNKTDVESLMQELRGKLPLRGIVHAAMVLDDALLPNLTEARFKSVVDVKAQGALNLDVASRQDQLDYFILFSSATTLIGNPGQANYVAANGFLEGLARRRRKEGLPALAVGFGAISDRGYLVGNGDVGEILSRRLGSSSIKAATALAFVEAYMASDPGTIDRAVVMCSPIDWSVASNLAVVSTSLFEVPLRKMNTTAVTGTDGIDLAAMIADKSESDALDVLYRLVAAEMAAVLRVAESTLSRDKVLKDAGLDSLMAVELGLSFKERTGVEIPLSGVGDTTTLDNVVRKLYERVLRSSTSEIDGDGGIADLEALASQHIDASHKAAHQA